MPSPIKVIDINKPYHINMHYTITVLNNCLEISPRPLSLDYVFTFGLGGQLDPTLEDIMQLSHDRVFSEKFCSVYVVEGV